MRLRRSRYMVGRELESGSREFLIRPAITQDTRPRPTDLLHSRHSSHTPSPSLGCYPPRPCPSFGMNVVPFVSILDETGFTPPGSPTGATLGIPAEHLLDEHETEMDDLIQPVPLHFHNPFNTPQKQLRALTDSDPSSCESDKDGGYIFLTPPRTESGSSGSDSPVRAAAGNSLMARPPATPSGFVGGTYRINGPYVVYTCNNCGFGTGFYTREQWAAMGNPLQL